MEKVYYRVSGRVQGVFFRAHTEQTARSLGLTGWVRNTRDGCVEGEAFGSTEDLDRFLEWLHQGSPHSRVDEVALKERGITEKAPSTFIVRY